MLDENPLSSICPVQENKILLAEDDPAIRRLLEVTLQKAGYNVLSAEDGLAALQLAISNNIEAIVADAIMPNLTGHDLCRILRQNPAFQETPFIILSGLEKEFDWESNLADAFIQKGADLKSRVLETLSSLLAREVFA